MSFETKNLLSRRPKKAKGILAQEADGVVVLLNLDSGLYYSLNESGGLVWSLCDGGLSGAEIALRLAEHYGRSPMEIEADVADLMRNLAYEKLLLDV